MSRDYIDIVFDAPPGPEGSRFVETESPAGKGISLALGWVSRVDGLWALRITPSDFNIGAAARSGAQRERGGEKGPRQAQNSPVAAAGLDRPAAAYGSPCDFAGQRPYDSEDRAESSSSASSASSAPAGTRSPANLAETQMRRALNALYLEVPETIASSVESLFNDYVIAVKTAMREGGLDA